MKIRLSEDKIRAGTSTVLTEFVELRELARQELEGVELSLYHLKGDFTFRLLVFPPVAWKPYNDFLKKFNAVEIEEPDRSQLLAIWGERRSAA